MTLDELRYDTKRLVQVVKRASHWTEYTCRRWLAGELGEPHTAVDLNTMPAEQLRRVRKICYAQANRLAGQKKWRDQRGQRKFRAGT